MCTYLLIELLPWETVVSIVLKQGDVVPSSMNENVRDWEFQLHLFYAQKSSLIVTAT